MKTANIPKTVTIKGALFPGVYKKRQMKSDNLFCWFNEDMAHFPHASIEISQTHAEWVDFHVSFSITKERGSWESGTETASYSVFVNINEQTDVITLARTTDTRNWKLSGTNPGFKGFADAERQGLSFAKEFYSAAFLGT